MSLAKKGSRRIVVDGQTYRWVVAPESGFFHVVVELQESPGQRVVSNFKYHDDDREFAGHKSKQRRIIRPSVVEILIREAFQRGWHPATKGPTLQIDGESLVPLD